MVSTRRLRRLRSIWSRRHPPIRVDQTRVDVGLDQVAPRVGAHAEGVGVDAQVAPLGDHDHLVAPGHALAEGARQCGAQAALARGHAIREGGGEDVDAALEQARDGRAVEHVVDTADLTVSHAQGQGGEGEAVGTVEVAGQVREALGEATRSQGRRASRSDLGGRHARQPSVRGPVRATRHSSPDAAGR